MADGTFDLTNTMLQIAARADLTLADVQRSAGEFGAFQAALTPYKPVLDLWVSQYFGNKPAGEPLTLHGDQALAAVKEQAVPWNTRCPCRLKDYVFGLQAERRLPRGAAPTIARYAIMVLGVTSSSRDELD